LLKEVDGILENGDVISFFCEGETGLEDDDLGGSDDDDDSGKGGDNG
jgi:hypothetical protein